MKKFTAGNTITATLTYDGTLTISGKGAMADSPEFPVKKITEVIIQEGVTSIGEYAFFNCTNLTTVTIPESVTSIGKFAFYGCKSLTTITIPESVTSIGEGQPSPTRKENFNESADRTLAPSSSHHVRW